MIPALFARLRGFSLSRFTLADYAAGLALLVPLLLIVGRALADAGMIVVSLLFLYHSYRTRDWTWLHTRWVQACFVIWGWLFVSATFALADHQTAFLRATTWIRWPLIAAAMTFWCSQRSWWPTLSGRFLIALIALVSLDTLIQYVFGMSLSGQIKPDYPGRLSGPFPANRLVVGIYLARLFWPALAALFRWTGEQASPFKRVLLPLGFIGLATLVILLSGERMAFLLTGLSFCIFFLFAKGFRKPLLLCGLPLVLVAIAVIATQPGIRARAVGAGHMISDFSKSGYGVIFNNALVAWKQSPVTGVGPKNFVMLCQQKGPELGYIDAQPDTPDIYDCARHPHNPYLEWLADTGLIGLGLFIALVFFWSRDAIRAVWQSRAAGPATYLSCLSLAVGLLPLLWPLQGNMSMFINWNAVLFWWAIGIIFAGLQKRS